MKKLLLLFVFLIGGYVFGQSNYVAHKFEMKTENDVFILEDLKAPELYQLTKVWLSETYKYPDNVIVADIENKLLKVNALAQIPSKGIFGNTTLNVKYSMQIDIKDGKIRVNISGLDGINKTNYSMFFKGDGRRRKTKEVERYLLDVEQYFNMLVDSLINSIDNGDNW